MRLRNWIAGGAAALAMAAASPAAAAIGTPTQIGAVASAAATATTFGIPVTGASAGNLLTAFIYTQSAATGLTCSDDASSPGWQTIAAYSSTAGKMWVCYNPNPLAGITTVTATWTSAARYNGVVVQTSGLNTSAPSDKVGAGAGGAAALNSGAGVNTGTATTQADELIFGFLLNGSTPGTWSDTTNSFTTLSGSQNSGGNASVNVGWRIVSSTGTYTFAPSWTNSVTWGVNIYTFKAAAAATPVCTLLLTGYGAC